MPVVLVSGGLDSCVAFATACAETNEEILPLSISYGQRHYVELEAADNIVEHFRLRNIRVAPRVHIDLTDVFQGIGGSSLIGDPDTTNPSEAERSTEFPPTFVPGRNIIFLAVAASLAHVNGFTSVYGGWNVLDYSGYPDCRPEFLSAMTEALNFGLGIWPPETVALFAVIAHPTPHGLRIKAPLLFKTKAQIINLGRNLDAPLHLTWSCYAGGEAPCGVCDSCKIRAAGFAEVGIPDPALERI